MEVDWGVKLRVNHTNECMPTEVHWGDHDPRLNPMDEYSISEVDWEALIQVTFFTLCTLILIQSQKISSPKSCGDDYCKGYLPPLSSA